MTPKRTHSKAIANGAATLTENTYSIGVDLGGTNLRIASFSDGTELLHSVQLSTRLSQGRDHVVRDMCEAISALLSRGYGEQSLKGIGIGSPGPLQLPEGILRQPPNLTDWDGFNLRAAIESILKHPVFLENDANVAALAEQKCGAGQLCVTDSLCMLTLGTGVGSGLVLNGRIWHGSTGMGGEAGHIVVQKDGVPCGCGGFGCLEQYASASAVVRMAKELMGNAAPNTSQELAALAVGGNQIARRVFEEVGRALATAFTGIINTLNLPLNLIGGGVCDAWDLFAPTMFQELRSRCYVYRLTEPSNKSHSELHTTRIERAKLGSAAGLLGAALLPYQ